MRLFLMTCDQFSTFCKHPHISLSTFKGKTDFKKGPTPVKLTFKAEPPRQVDSQGDYLCSGCACTKELRSRGVTFCYWGSQVCHLITILSFTIKRKVAKVSFYTKKIPRISQLQEIYPKSQRFKQFLQMSVLGHAGNGAGPTDRQTEQF